MQILRSVISHLSNAVPEPESSPSGMTRAITVKPCVRTFDCGANWQNDRACGNCCLRFRSRPCADCSSFRCSPRSLGDCSCRRRISALLGVGRWALRINDLGGAPVVAQLPLERVIFRFILNYAFQADDCEGLPAQDGDRAGFRESFAAEPAVKMSVAPSLAGVIWTSTPIGQ
jgi:hypothetical protein